MNALQDRLAVATTATALRLTDAVERGSSQAARSTSTAYRWVWIVLIGVLVVAAAAAFVYCRARGYNGFTGNIEAVRGPFGVKIGVKLGCY